MVEIRVVQAADGVEVVGHGVPGGGSEEHERAVRRDRLAHVAGHGGGVAHVMQRVEDGDDIEGARVLVGGSDLERHPLRGQPRVFGTLPRRVDGGLVVVVAHERRVRVGLSEQGR
jgi:hypothetical protein